MTIVTIPHPSLRIHAEPVDQVDSEFINKADELLETLRLASNPPGVGLAATQVNWNQRVFALWVEHHKPGQIIINPSIRATSRKKTLGPNKRKPLLEGCLSIKDYYAPVYRYEWIVLDYSRISPSGLTQATDRFEAFTARVIQHELDHLDGILFTDHALSDNLPIYKDTGNTLVPLEDTEIELLLKA